MKEQEKKESLLPKKRAVEEFIEPRSAKTLLGLDEEHFKQYEDFANDYDQLIYNPRGSNYNDFIRACKILLQREKGLVLSNRKLYNGFVQKYDFLLNYFFDNDFSISLNVHKKHFYKYLKDNYDRKNHFLEVLEKLCELGLKDIDTKFIPYGNFDGIYEIETSKYIKQGVATDGQITWLPQTSTFSYPVQIEGANYVLEYKKRKATRPGLAIFNGTSVIMKFKNLNFDIETLPSYEALHDFSVDIPIDTETAKQKKDSLNRIELLNSAKKQTEKLLSILQSLTQRLEYCEDRKEVQAIISKIEEIKQLYNLIKALEPMLYDDAKGQSGMDKKEIQKTLHKETLNTY